MLRKPSGQFNGKPFPEVGESFETTEDHANALVTLKYAERLGEPEKPAEKPETATDTNADERETREAKDKPEDKPVKRGPGRPRKADK